MLNAKTVKVKKDMAINAKSKTCLSKGAKVKAVRSNKLELQLDFAALVVMLGTDFTSKTAQN